MGNKGCYVVNVLFFFSLCNEVFIGRVKKKHNIKLKNVGNKVFFYFFFFSQHSQYKTVRLSVSVFVCLSKLLSKWSVFVNLTAEPFQPM